MANGELLDDIFYVSGEPEPEVVIEEPVQWINIEVIGTQLKMEAIKDWLEPRMEVAEMHDRLQGSLTVYKGVDSDRFIMSCTAYFKGDVSKTKYPDLIKTQLQNLNKTGIDNILIQKYDYCTHNHKNFKPCIPTKEYEWSA